MLFQLGKVNLIPLYNVFNLFFVVKRASKALLGAIKLNDVEQYTLESLEGNGIMPTIIK